MGDPSPGYDAHEWRSCSCAERGGDVMCRLQDRCGDGWRHVGSACHGRLVDLDGIAELAAGTHCGGEGR